MILSIASGKGETGKTLLSTSLALGRLHPEQAIREIWGRTVGILDNDDQKKEDDGT
ncbi:MAG: hypothetical protein WBB73_00485 [Candidatus Aminicenantaceae bacterium]